MKTFCVVKDNGTHDLVQGVSVFEVDGTFTAMQRAINLCCVEKRPYSSLVAYPRRGGLTYFADRLPFAVGENMFTKVKPHSCL